MSIVQIQIDALKQSFPNSDVKELPDGQFLVTVSGVKLPPNDWNKQQAVVSFVVPRGYPMANPDCFYADEDLRLRSGAFPKNSSLQSQPFFSGQRLWFSWHFASWNPNRDNLLSYVRMIQKRLRQPE